MTTPLSSTRGPLRPSGAGRPISTTRLQVGMPGGDGRTSLTPSGSAFTLRSGTLLTSLASRPSAAWPSGETRTRSRPPRPSGGMKDSSSARPVSGSAWTSRYAVGRIAGQLRDPRLAGLVQRLHQGDVPPVELAGVEHADRGGRRLRGRRLRLPGGGGGGQHLLRRSPSGPRAGQSSRPFGTLRVGTPGHRCSGRAGLRGRAGRRATAGRRRRAAAGTSDRDGAEHQRGDRGGGEDGRGHPAAAPRRGGCPAGRRPRRTAARRGRPAGPERDPGRGGPRRRSAGPELGRRGLRGRRRAAARGAGSPAGGGAAPAAGGRRRAAAHRSAVTRGPAAGPPGRPARRPTRASGCGAPTAGPVRAPCRPALLRAAAGIGAQLPTRSGVAGTGAPGPGPGARAAGSRPASGSPEGCRRRASAADTSRPGSGTPFSVGRSVSRPASASASTLRGALPIRSAICSSDSPSPYRSTSTARRRAGRPPSAVQAAACRPGGSGSSACPPGPASAMKARTSSARATSSAPGRAGAAGVLGRRGQRALRQPIRPHLVAGQQVRLAQQVVPAGSRPAVAGPSRVVPHIPVRIAPLPGHQPARLGGRL